ncbi:22365_t:CDS:2, partial [Gigaspora margarita]
SFVVALPFVALETNLKKTIEDVISLESTSSSPVEFDAANNMSTELMIVETNDSLVETEPVDDEGFQLSASLQLDYENGFLEDQLDMPQQNVSNAIVPDLHIIEQIRSNNMLNTKDQQIINKKVRYTNGFEKIKKALNTTLDLEYEKELINIITCFINQKVSIYENFNNEYASSDQSKQIVIMDPLVVKHCERPATKRLKSFSKINGHQALKYNQSAINSQDPNLRIPFSRVVSN